MAQPQPTPQRDVTELLRRAAGHHQRGELTSAEALYREALAQRPDSFDALHLYGVLMHQRGRSVEALKLIGQALKANANAAPAY
ncbi:MAG TPA: tetratricopeptide repeat protein, partial [Pseudolabrys sp.]|nr:tetratricopeptide repeat protein [Pseudolabrys sp.]